MSALGFRIFDADNHYYEPRDAFTRHMDPRHTAVRVETDANGKDTFLVAGNKHYFLPPTFDLVPSPGMLAEMMRSQGEGTAASFLKPMRPAYQQRGARLEVMDVQGVETVLMFLTLGVTVEHTLRQDPEATFANLRAFNGWIDEDWGRSRSCSARTGPIPRASPSRRPARATCRTEPLSPICGR